MVFSAGASCGYRRERQNSWKVKVDEISETKISEPFDSPA
jgi:hypothetical protein